MSAPQIFNNESLVLEIDPRVLARDTSLGVERREVDRGHDPVFGVGTPNYHRIFSARDTLSDLLVLIDVQTEVDSCLRRIQPPDAERLLSCP